MNCPEAQATLSSGANNSLYVHSWEFSAWGYPGVLRYGQKQCLTSGDKGKLCSLAPIPTISPNLTHTQMLPLVARYPLWFLFNETDVFSEAEPASAEAAFSLACVTVASGYPRPLPHPLCLDLQAPFLVFQHFMADPGKDRCHSSQMPRA